MQKKILNKYSKLSTPLFSKGRMFKEKKNKFRNPYVRDRYRIIIFNLTRISSYTPKFLLIIEFIITELGLLHSLEVSQIARTIAKYFVNEDLCKL